jgi:hypothetical protein
MARHLLGAFLLLSAPLFAQQNQLTPEQESSLKYQASLEITFRNPPASITRLALGVAGTAEMDGLKVIRYSVRAPGIPQGGPYFLMTWDIGTRAPVIAMPDLQVDLSGALLCNDKKGCNGSSPGADVVVGVTGMVGQPRRFVLTGKDKKPLAMGEVVPFPASGTDGNCTVEAVLLAPNGAATLLLGSGFEPNEPIAFASTSWDEKVGSTRNADANGAYQSMVLPFVKGHDQGDTSVEVPPEHFVSLGRISGGQGGAKGWPIAEGSRFITASHAKKKGRRPSTGSRATIGNP